jgi:3'-phosphoadenosine 5'-phosphosulfate sulfotransferase (PAPS reductase)/FAD synthetase
VDAPFLIGAGCCNEMKKKPLKIYAKESGRVPIIGTMACESQLRTQRWLLSGCNAFDNKRPTSTPLSFWVEEDIWEYIHRFNVPYSRVYDMGYVRTGCIFCMFGVHLEPQPNRFQRLQKTHPKLWRYCMRDWDSGGLGLRRVLEYIGVPYENFLL